VGLRSWGFKSPLAHEVLLDRTRRRRRRLVWPLVISLLAVAALLAANVGRRASGTVSYLEAIRAETVTLAQDAGLFVDALARLRSMGRDEFITVLDNLSHDLDRAAGVVATPPEAGAIVGVASLFRLTISAWTEGVEQFRTGVLDAADRPSTAPGADLVTTGLYRLEDGDRLYEALLEELARQEVPDPITPLPSIRFVQTNVPLPIAGSTFAAAAAAEDSLIRLRADLSIEQVSSDPEWVTNPDRTLVIVNTEVMAVEVVVANKGNGPSSPLVLSLDLSGDDGTVLNDQATVPELRAGEQTVISFSDLAVRPGGLYRLEVRLQITDPDRDVENNARTVDFVINEGSA
jgi:hypothetical protein